MKKRKRKSPTAARARQRIARTAATRKTERKKLRRFIWPAAVVAALALLAGIAFGIYNIWLFNQPKFHDVTVELGTNSLGIADFMTEYANPGKARFVTDPSELDLGKTGEREVILSHGGREETVVLRVEDTLPPAVDFYRNLSKTAGYVPSPEDFIERIADESPTDVFFTDEPDLSDPYADADFTVAVRDAAGHVVSGECRLVRSWLRSRVDIELGEQKTKEDFLLDPGFGAELISDEELERINTMGPGTTELDIDAGGKRSGCVITVRDTTPPEVEFETAISHPGHTLPAPETFIKSVRDYSETTVYYEGTPDDYDGDEDITLTVIVEDSEGNRTAEQCVVTRGWMRREYTLELGGRLTAGDLLLDPEYGEEYISAEELAAINGSPVGTYTVHSRSGDREITCTVHVADTVPPSLVLQDRRVYLGRTAGVWDFIQSVWDASGDVSVAFVKTPSFSNTGTYEVSIEAKDKNGNTTVKTAALSVVEDRDPPQISGLSNMTVSKYSSPDFTKGVSAWDANDGSVSVTCDASGADISRYGTYYITYTASDKAGNTATARRQVYVMPDSDDTAQIVKNIAAKLPADVEALRDYVRSNISYNHDWGGDDPVYYGFIHGAGNCLVHASCLKALLDEKGITDNLICHVILEKYEPHYWNIVRINGVYKHVDSTPGTSHSRYSLMNDAQRYETLKGRDWDRSQYPVCE